ncbi:hypothetical protein CUR178_07334 [Leishmania enriettii]|uniref:Uncharacterized protein n=1 Tax=Leishmania enriettii TaxID=5663 RepID=A0A836HWJ2_LEIEN|nr:hypothetical protein CUR178_07334 [Leishmania enriettii]
MSALYTFILRDYPSLDTELPRPPPSHRRHSSQVVGHREKGPPPTTGVTAAAALWAITEPSPSTGLTCPIPLEFGAAHPIARLETEKSAAGYRACGVQVWHRQLSMSRTDASALCSACSAHPLLRPVPENGTRAERSSRYYAQFSSCRSDDRSDCSRSSSASSISPRADPGTAGPRPTPSARSGTMFTPQATPA